MKVVLATANQGKIRELEKLLLPLGIDVTSQADYPGFPAIVEDGKSFEENAVKKARAAASYTGQVALADDSGLEVDYLGGAPGIYSARFSCLDDTCTCSGDGRAHLNCGVSRTRANCSSGRVQANGANCGSGCVRINGSQDAFGGSRALLDRANNEKLLALLEGVPWEKRTARFRCVIAIAVPGGKIYTAKGTCEGYIAFEPKGAGGFGYDPLFYLPEYGKTFAELDTEAKNRISHRGRALAGAVEIIRRLMV